MELECTGGRLRPANARPDRKPFGGYLRRNHAKTRAISDSRPTKTDVFLSTQGTPSPRRTCRMFRSKTLPSMRRSIVRYGRPPQVDHNMSNGWVLLILWSTWGGLP